ncbi:MAG: FtsX-like permease family protein [Tissierellia bacterium]|nr:FtsX-like permease family protein [Tissierellia bacterium]
MGNSLMKDTFRQILKSPGRYLAILLIVALGVGFFAGIKATAPDMKVTADKYFDDYRLMDFWLISTMGFNEKDVEALKRLEAIEGIQPSYSIDLLAAFEGNESVVKVISLPLDKVNSNDPSYINKIKLVEGRLPEKPGEILAEHGNGINPTYPIGSKIKFSSGRDEDISEFLKGDEYTVVGLVETPLYLSFERGSSNIGSGKISSFMMLPQGEFKLEVYTDIYLTVKEAREAMTYDDEYDEILDPIKEKLEEIGQKRATLRYDEIIKEANEELSKAKKELADGERELEEELEKAERELEEARKKIEEGEEELEKNERNFYSQIQKAEGLLREEEKKLNKAEGEYERNLALFNEKKVKAMEEFQRAEGEILQAEREITDREAELNSLKEGLSLIKDEEERAKTQALIQYMEAEINKGKKELVAARNKLEAGKADLIQGEKELEAAKLAIEEGRARLEAEWENLERNKREALDSFAAARRELAQGREEYEKGYEEYLKAKEEGERELREAREKIKEEEEKLKDLKKPEWYVLKRSQTRDYIDYEMAADRIDAVASVFPVFFLAIAILVSLTSMTRMVDEERTYIGTLKALGYKNMAIASKYLIYAASASIIGSIIGLLIGFKVLPTVIFNAYRIMYIMPPIIGQFNIKYALVSILVAVLSTTLAAWLACRHELNETPAFLLRPKAPKPGKRIWLEKIPFIWSRMKFSQKVTARNIFRYKKRMFMTILGVSGCTALLVTGFGLKDSIVSIVAKQFDEIYKYQMVVELQEGIDENTDHEVLDFLEQDSRIKDYLLTRGIVVDIGKGNIEKSVNLFVTKDSEKIHDFIILRNRLTKEKLSLEEEGVILSEKIAKLLDVQVGDQIYIVHDNERIYVKITGITEHYADHYMYMSSSLYEKLYNKGVEYQRILAHTTATEKELEDKLSQHILKLNNISSVYFTTGISDSYEDIIGSLNYVVIVIIVAAGALAFIVLYNLTNINISERFREIATIKVLGFYDSEVANYIYR